MSWKTENFKRKYGINAVLNKVININRRKLNNNVENKIK